MYRRARARTHTHTRARARKHTHTQDLRERVTGDSYGRDDAPEYEYQEDSTAVMAELEERKNADTEAEIEATRMKLLSLRMKLLKEKNNPDHEVC